MFFLLDTLKCQRIVTLIGCDQKMTAPYQSPKRAGEQRDQGTPGKLRQDNDVEETALNTAPRHAMAVVMDAPEKLGLVELQLDTPGASDVVVAVEWSGISTGTERLIYSGRMPPFPGFGFPLVPGYESVGRIIEAGPDSHLKPGQAVFVPGARCFGAVKGLFGGVASCLITSSSRVTPLLSHTGEESVLLALAATAQHALAGGPPPDLIIGHGVLGRLLARLTIAGGHAAPVVWENHPDRAQGASGYSVVDAGTDSRRDYKTIYDVSGDASLLNTLIGRLAPGGQIVLAGFYHQPLSFDFAPAFMREANIRIAAEWKAPDLDVVQQLLARKALSLDGLITHCVPASSAASAYETAFNDVRCLKMILDWRQLQ